MVEELLRENRNPMQLNAMFPTRDIGNDPAKIRDWAQAAEDLGYAYIEVPDHVFGATARDGWTPRYNERDPFHETFVTLGFLAAVTKKDPVVERHPDRTAAANRAHRQAGGRSRSSERWSLEARHRRRLEPCRIRGARRRLENARRTAGGAGRGVAPAVVRGVGRL